MVDTNGKNTLKRMLFLYQTSHIAQRMLPQHNTEHSQRKCLSQDCKNCHTGQTKVPSISSLCRMSICDCSETECEKQNNKKWSLFLTISC